MKMKKLIALHVAGWVLALSFFVIPVFFVGFTNKVIYTIASFLLYIGVFYINLLLILPSWIKQRNLVLLFTSWFILVVLYTMISVLLDHLLHVFERNGHTGLEWLNAFLRNCLFVGIFLFISTAYRSITDWFKNERFRHQIENERLKTELLFLKSQINPHFLLNTLNNIYILAYQGSLKTADAVMKLSEMMQYMLYESTDQYVPVSSELHYIRQFIDLQQIRMKDTMYLDFSVSGNMEKYKIAPLLLIAFVENIFKHGVLNDKEEPATVRLKIADGNFIFYSRNKINYNIKDIAGGIGLSNVKRRMELLYPNRHHFEVIKGETHFSIHLVIQFE